MPYELDGSGRGGLGQLDAYGQPVTRDDCTAHVPCEEVLDELGVETLGDVTTEQLVELLANKRWKPNTRRSYRASLRTFFSWARASPDRALARGPDPGSRRSRGPSRGPSLSRHTATALQVAKYDRRLRSRDPARWPVRPAALRDREGPHRRRRRGPGRVHAAGGRQGWPRADGAPARRTSPTSCSCCLEGGCSRRRGSRAGTPRPARSAAGSLHGAGPGYTTHNLRHRCGTVALMRNSGGDLRAVQELLGHAKPETTHDLHAHRSGCDPGRHGVGSLKYLR
jgi:hypothetical protein